MHRAFLAFPLALLAACAAPAESSTQESEDRQTIKVPPSVGSEAVCNPTATTLVDLEARRMVFAVDRSASSEANWSAMADGLKGFFANGQSTGVEASLHLFPTNDSANSCNAASYAIPQIPSYPLPNDSLFSRLLTNAKPAGGATAVVALAGAVADARAQAASGGTPPEVLFVSTGASDACSGASPFAALAKEAKSAFEGSPSVRVHFVTVGDFGAAADAVALAGGTEKARVVTPGASLANELKLGVAEIATPAERCSVSIPASVKALDLDKATLFVGTTRTDASHVAYSATCADPNGFRVDDVAHPTKIEFCESSCAIARQERVFRINQGCKTGTDIVAAAPTEESSIF